jgi:sulfur-oxidizing protein SoxY
MNRRGALSMIGSGIAITLLPHMGNADQEDVDAGIKKLFGDRPLQHGRVTLQLPKLAESGNSVPVKVTVKSAMSPTDRVLRACIFADRNPRALIATVIFGPNAASATFSTNMRLSGTQDVIAIAEMSDNSLWTSRTRVMVTIGACDVLQTRY